MYELAVAAGKARLLLDAPTTLFRWHGKNSSGGYGDWGNGAVPRPTTTWREHQNLRRAMSRNAEGFMLAAKTLPQSGKLAWLLEIADLVARTRQRQSPAALLKLLLQGALWANRRLALEAATVCLCSDAT
jgi:hypothetical protein